jgi:acyl-CoA thioesterase
MAHFDEETAVTPVGDSRWRGMVSPRWSIGEVANGGYVQAIALSAVAASLPHPHPLTVTTHFLRPCTAEPVDIDVEVVRAGRTVSTAMASLRQEGTERVRVLAAFGDLSTADGPTLVVGRPPQLPPVEECVGRREGLTLPGGAEGIATRVDLRLDPTSAAWVTGGPPDGTTSYRTWVRLADGRPADALCLPLLVDVMAPAVFGAVARHWVPTLELTTHVRGLPARGWLRAAVATRFLINGAFEEEVELWDADDRLVAQSRQLARVLTG